MAIVTSDILLLTFAGIKTEFDAAYILASANADWKQVAEEIETTLPIQNYAWLGRGAVMQEFKDEVAQQSLREDQYTLGDKTYKANMTVSRRAMEDDQYGMLMKRAKTLSNEPVRHWNELAFTGLANGFSATAYDGLSFFNATHSEGTSGNQSNLTSASLSDSALQLAEAAMMAYVDDKAKPLEIQPDTLVVGPSNKRKAEDLVGSAIVVSRVGDGTAGTGATAATPFDNYFRGKYKIVTSPYLIGVSAYNWFLLDTKRDVKPIVIQSRSDVPITLETDMMDGAAHIKEEYNITVRGRYVQGYGLWQVAYGSNATS